MSRVLFIAATLLFAVQNFEMVTISFLGFGARPPLALLLPWCILYEWRRAALRRSVQGSRRTPGP